MPASRTPEGRAVRRRLGRVVADRSPGARRACSRCRCRPPSRPRRSPIGTIAAELLDRHLLAVVGDRAAVGPRQVVEEEPVLQAARAVQGHVAEALAKRARPAARARLAVGRADRERERGAQHRRVRGGLQDRLVLAGELAVLLGQRPRVRRAPLRAARGRRARRRGCACAPGRALRGCRPSGAWRTASTGNADAFERGEEQLGGAGELGLFGERAGAEERLEGGALFGLDLKRGRLAGVLDQRRVRAAPEVVLERLVGERRRRRLEDQRVGLPVRARARARRRRERRRGAAATAAPGVVARRRPSAARAARRCAARPPPAPRARRPGSARGAPTPASSSSRRRAPSTERTSAAAAVGLGEGDREIDLRRRGSRAAPSRSLVAGEVAPPAARGRRGRDRPSSRELAGVALGRVGALHPPEREVRADEVGEALQPAERAPTSRAPAGTGRRSSAAR